MSTTFHHQHGRAVVAFHDAVTWPSAFALADVLDTVVEEYFYGLVELVVTSPGGDVRALHHVLDTLATHRARGVRFRTRVLANAESAAAVLACVGCERFAAPQARLLLHSSRAIGLDAVTAGDSARLTGALARVDAGLLALLVERALRGVDPHRALRAEPDDRAVLERLLPDARPGGRRPVRVAARALGRTVTRAVRERDRPALERLYRRLLETETPLSAPLACTLGLLDAVTVTGAAPRERAPDAGPPGLVVPEWAALYPPKGAVPRAALTRHALVLGESGSGKTQSAAKPVCAAMARAGATRLATALIIDPKGDLAPMLAALAPARLRHLRADSIVLDLMAAPRLRLDADLAAGRWTSAATRILARVASFVPGNPARVLLAGRTTKGYDQFFDRNGAALARTVLALVLMLTAPKSPPPVEWLDDPPARAWVETLRARAERGPNALALTAWALESALLAVEEPGTYRQTAPPWLLSRIARAALGRPRRTRSAEARDLLASVDAYWLPMTVAERQFLGVRASAANVCVELAAPAVASHLYFGCEPGFRHRGRASVDFTRAVAPGDDAETPLVLYQPARDDADTLVAVALKAAFFEAVLDDPVRARGGDHLPLVGYVADEAHRFITSDPLHGEQSFLDTCRSFGAMCVLACQSVASLEHALAHRGGSPELNESAIAVVWANTATKLVFRSTDPRTAERLGELCPHRPGLEGVTRVRPVSTLATGEAYALLPDGRFERRQLAPFDLARKPARGRGGTD